MSWSIPRPSISTARGGRLGGVVLGTQKFITETLQPFLRHTGPSLSPMNAWVLLKGLETLELRVTRQAASAETIARKLAGHAKLAQVLYPTLGELPAACAGRSGRCSGGGTMVGFSLKGGKAAAFKFLNALELVLISNNLGDSKSLATHPMTTTHQRLTPNNARRRASTTG